MSRDAEHRLSAGLVKNGVSIAIDREYKGHKHVTLDLDQLVRFIGHLNNLCDRLAQREAEQEVAS